MERFSIVGDTSRGEWHLRIKHVTPADNGRYECQLHSGGEDAAADVLVRVEPKDRVRFKNSLILYSLLVRLATIQF